MNQQITGYLKKFGLAELFPEKLQQTMRLETFQAGECLFSQGEKADTVYFLVEGKLKVSMLSPEGKRLILAFKTPLDIVGDIEYVRQCAFINTVEAVMETVVIRIPSQLVRDEMASHTAWLQFLLETITRKFEKKSHAMNFNLLYSVDVRVASYLLSMTPTDPVIGSTSLIDMADLIGTSYRHLNRVLHNFEENGWITKKRGTITLLDRSALLEQASRNIYE